MHFKFASLTQQVCTFICKKSLCVRTMRYTCALLVWRPPFALSIHVGAEGPGEVLVHHAADVPLVVGEEDTARSQVLCLRGLLLLLGALLWP